MNYKVKFKTKFPRVDNIQVGHTILVPVEDCQGNAYTARITKEGQNKFMCEFPAPGYEPLLDTSYKVLEPPYNNVEFKIEEKND